MPGPHRDIALLNAAAGLVAAGAAATLEEGLARAERSVDDGAAATALDRLIAASTA
jgi:anthranilate phosphoribosyltransferase